MGNSNLRLDASIQSRRRPALTSGWPRGACFEALDGLMAGTEALGFHGWENGHGEPAGDLVEEIRRELEVLLADTPRSTQLLTGADFDPAAFDAVLRSEAVQRAGRDFGFRGVAEAVWAAAFAHVRVPSAGSSKGDEPCA